MSHGPECGYVTSTVLEHLGNQIVITEEIMMCCSRCCEANTVLSLILREKPTFDTQFFQNLTDAAVSNHLHGSSIINSLLEQYPLLRFTITERTVAYAQDNFAAIEALLKFPKDRYSVSREALFAAAGNSEQLLGLLLSRGEDSYVTREAILSAVGSPEDGYMVGLILESTVLRCESTDDAEFESFKSLFHRLGGKTVVTDHLIRAAIRSWNGKRILQFLLNIAGDSYRIREDMAAEAATGTPKTLKFLLRRFGSSFPITEKVLEAATCADHSGALPLILHRAKHIPITEIMMEGILGRSQQFRTYSWWSVPQAKLELLYTRGKRIQVTEDILVAAAGQNVVDVLVRQYPNEVRKCLTDRVLLATAASSRSIKFLRLYERKFGCNITEEVRLVYRPQMAVDAMHLWAVQRLLTQGAPPDTADTADSDSDIPLHFAALRGRQSIVEVLLQTHAVNVDSVNILGESPLFNAVRNGYTAIVRLLLEAGANPNIVNIRGQTAYSIAYDNIHLRIMRTLEEFGTDRDLASCVGGLELYDDHPRLASWSNLMDLERYRMLLDEE
ncbi:ankyrin repeat-containing domain protein [Aspergillus keveii]|uniref:Ankyrin repeat-containing domain protein n=1 Tax=Aspergillus keveii TaxID=714993 RepID=A0ABR4GD72_9EURO